MSEIIKWSELTRKQRDRLIGEKVMGDTYTCNVVPDFTTHQNPSRAGGIAFTHTTWLCPACGATGYYGKESLVAHEKPSPIPGYSASLDAAWLVVRKMNVPVEGKFDRYARFIDALESIVGSDLFFDLFYCDSASDDQHLTAERICIAALRAVGVQVEVQS